MKVSFGTTTVQKNRRVAIDPNLLENVGLEEGDEVHLFFDTNISAIVIEKKKLQHTDNSSNKDDGRPSHDK